jgi:hypothetical protein
VSTLIRSGMFVCFKVYYSVASHLVAQLLCLRPLDFMSHLVQAGATEPPVVMCLLDNRGVGLSSSPPKKKDYSTQLMAKDAALVMVC